MKSSAKKIELASVDDLFSTEESRQDEQLEKIQEIPLSELHPFKDHPFKVKDDDAMIETADSIKKYGVLVPAIARPLPDGGYDNPIQDRETIDGVADGQMCREIQWKCQYEDALIQPPRGVLDINMGKYASGGR